MSYLYAHAQPQSWSAPPVPSLTPNNCQLCIRQQPKEALVTTDGKEKARKPLDPPPILQLVVTPQSDPHRQYLQSPYLFVSISLLKPDKDEPYDETGEKSLLGSLVSSLHRLKDVDNKDSGFFIFGDISIRVQGQYRLRFTLFELQSQSLSSQFYSSTSQVQCLGSIDSDVFNVLASKDFKGMVESTYLSRAFSDQGVRLRLRKEQRSTMGKRPHPYGGDEPDDAPTHSEMNSSPQHKKSRVEPDERQGSFLQRPGHSLATYAPPYPTQNYYAPQYRLPNLPNIPNTMSMQHMYGNVANTMPGYSHTSLEEYPNENPFPPML